ncbi:hypothetical protein COV20_04080 [Candidatus Woesearchaeota archaeon CG10_big_fil_rev_8_21_14_0_10_45_16]|nr:MAG: hypothetical protein COV20_04080 [Candidatus Woesearchaeota archaeon CG10_big_fil_rev_8_21_14_0_10_45_16]
MKATKFLMITSFILILVLMTSCFQNQPKQKIKPASIPVKEQCQGEFCNDDVEIICQSSNCDAELSQQYLQLQTKVVKCLDNYFQFSAPRVSYKISSKEKTACEQEGGCCCTTGGMTDWSGVSQSYLYGNTPFGATGVQSPKDIIAEEHETTHFFLFQMLKGHPAWFSEAIAIQTNERAGCDVSAMDLEGNAKEFAKKGDAYLRETNLDLQSSGGVKMSDGSILDNDYYLRLKNGESSLETRDSHTIGALWVIGLKEDYGCEQQCILRIVKELQKYTESQCRPGTYCGDNPLQYPEIVTDEVIKEKTDLITGRDTRELFELLGIL